MPLAIERPEGGCLAPVVLDHVVDDPESIREMARASGPYFMPARYLVGGQTAAEARAGTPIEIEHSPPHLIGPVWRGDWAFDGVALVDGADRLLNLAGFVDAAAEMCGSEHVEPQQVFVNVSTPIGTGRTHVDIPEFYGITRSEAPGWMLIAMGNSGLFEDVRTTIITAVTWFYEGEGGEFTYWPDGPDGHGVLHENMWNTGVVGDNDFMFHRVERAGPRDQRAPDGMTLNTTLDHIDGRWRIVERDDELATYDDRDVRLSLSWKARVHASSDDAAGTGRGIEMPEVLARFSDDLGHQLPSDAADPAVYQALISRYTNYA